ncbi:hypothetical protein [Thalassoglobus polymorphus]|uniref:hypothetical protein n=1 Tax=Thalassoglobus polymorphus TaxID=2527994 RepID=UPI00119EF692|nr:hypothetical protein [Thalassoglobus polymorphus]
MSNTKQEDFTLDRRLNCVDKLASQADSSRSLHLRRELLKAACHMLEDELFQEPQSPSTL